MLCSLHRTLNKIVRGRFEQKTEHRPDRRSSECPSGRWSYHCICTNKWITQWIFFCCFKHILSVLAPWNIAQLTPFRRFHGVNLCVSVAEIWTLNSKFLTQNSFSQVLYRARGPIKLIRVKSRLDPLNAVRKRALKYDIFFDSCSNKFQNTY